MDNIILSIAIPTLNRAEILQFTLEQFIPQIERNKDKVELVICNNASDDDTANIIKKVQSKYNYIKFQDCNNRVDLGSSFKRTVDFSSGKYVILWGDDDIPMPALVDYLLSIIEIFPEIGLFYFNRLIGYEDGCAIKSLSVYETKYSDIRKIYNSSSDFIYDNFWGATFMSAIMFSKNVWIRGLNFDTSTHYGFEFMGILYYGNKGGKIDFENYPLCIQRKVAKRSWSSDWPKYALLGLPNMSRDLEIEGLFDDGINVWRKKYNKFLLFCYILISAATDKKKYRPLCKEFAHYQNGFIRKSLIYLIINFMPGFIYNISRRILFKMK